MTFAPIAPTTTVAPTKIANDTYVIHQAVISPAYDLGATEDELRQQYLRRLTDPEQSEIGTAEPI